ncbi:DUF1361 domain-containing protein [Microbacterium sp. Clip185]|uniref:DUF1361 domain-containing protein n=1 Tax=Microbacterium sp. Clip185 TaxID=3025663 RepID=UPI002366896C|nr:DUF1361 domain-containing protein [Microbacterium sp. Clip185]WDG17819.1 DUF1361 domain-containing protein [Microbacterium sp. Clip185]
MNAILTALVCVILLNAYAALLILLRAKVYGVPLYRPMLVNIGLSLAPVALAFVGLIGFLLVAPAALSLVSISATLPAAAVWIYLGVVTLVWLVFFPNSIYLITELNFSHRREHTPVPLWYDIVHTLTLTGSGLANAVLSLALIQFGLIVVIADPAAGSGPPGWSWIFAAGAILLGSVGVYLGRYLRLNSWDVRHPATLIRKLRDHFAARGKALEGVAFVATHTVLVALLYVPIFGLAYTAILS